MSATDYLAYVVTLAVILGISMPILNRYALSEGSPWLKRLLVIALLLKLAAAGAREWVAFGLYGGTADAGPYFKTGNELASLWRSGDWSLAPLDGRPLTGTQATEVITGVVSLLVGPHRSAQYLIFSWLGFWGLFLLFRAFRVAVGDGDWRRYALLLFLLPSMLFWPSGIGKEACMIFLLGFAAYGAALLLNRRRGALVPLAIGVGGAAWIRPHVALMIFLGLLFGYMLRSSTATAGRRPNGFRSALGMVALLGVTLLLVRQVESFLKIDDLNVGSGTDAFSNVQDRSSRGGSGFEGGGAPSLTNLPMAIVTVLYRPFLFEASGVAVITAAEGAVLLLLTWVHRKRLRTIPSRLRRQPYLLFCLVYSIIFCFFFSALQNFGLLARERVQVYPFVLALFCVSAERLQRRGTPVAVVAPEPVRGRARPVGAQRRTSSLRR